MIGKAGGGGAGTVRYVVTKKKAEKLPVGLHIEQWREAEWHMATVESTRRGLADRRRHFSLSLSQGESLTSEQWVQVVERYMERMGYDDAPYIAYRHHDQPHDHVPVVAARVRYDRGVVSASFERVRSRDVIREIEQEFGLRETARAYEAAKRGLNQREVQRANRALAPTAGEPQAEMPSRVMLQEAISRASEGRPTVGEWLQRLEASGVGVRANVQTTGRVAGCSFSWRGSAAMKGSELGKDYAWKSLADRIDYVPERDADLLREAAARTETRQASTSPATPQSPPLPPMEQGIGLREVARAHEAAKRRLTQREGQPTMPTQAPTAGEPPVEKPAQVMLQEAISRASEGRPTASEWVRRLEASGVGVRANVQTTGRVAGCSFSWQGAPAMKGSDLGKDYAWKALSARVDYLPARDADVLREAASRTQAPADAPAPEPPLPPALPRQLAAVLGVEPPRPPGDVSRIRTSAWRQVAFRELQHLVGALTRLERRFAGIVRGLLEGRQLRLAVAFERSFGLVPAADERTRTPERPQPVRDGAVASLLKALSHRRGGRER